MTNLGILWPPPPALWLAGNGEMHVWAGSLQVPETQILEFALTLSQDETARAARFHCHKHRDRFIVGRGLLRAILSRYVGRSPAELAFNYGPNGKPALALKEGKSPLLFNLAHAEDLLLLAVSRVSEVGIDVEQIRAFGDADSIAASHFSHREAVGLRNLPAAQRLKAFYALWTRKEALLKATGDGIGQSLSQVEVSFSEGEPARLLELHGSSEAAQAWTLRELLPAPGFLGALAVPGTDIRLNCWRWSE